LLLSALAGSAWAGEILATVKSAKMLRCGVSTGIAGFSERGADGVWRGMDVDFCRAVAAAVIGDATRVSYKALPTLARFPALMSGEIDILARNTTWSLRREVMLGIVFTGPLAYSTQGVLVGSQSDIRDIPDLDKTKICVVRDSTQDVSLNFWAMRKGLRLEKLDFDNDEQARESFFKGQCQGYASDAMLLASLRLTAPGGKDAYRIIKDDSTLDPLSPAVRQGDNEWRQLVEAVWASLLLAQEFGLGQAAFAPGAPTSPPKEVFLSKSDTLAKSFGIEPGWAARALAAVGNYGEMYRRNLGAESPLDLEEGPNRLWSQGGLMIPPDF
jgi:general L-amino acid transport system substrate-binding protein